MTRLVLLMSVQVYVLSQGPDSLEVRGVFAEVPMYGTNAHFILLIPSFRLKNKSLRQTKPDRPTRTINLINTPWLADKVSRNGKQEDVRETSFLFSLKNFETFESTFAGILPKANRLELQRVT